MRVGGARGPRTHTPTPPPPGGAPAVPSPCCLPFAVRGAGSPMVNARCRADELDFVRCAPPLPPARPYPRAVALEHFSFLFGLPFLPQVPFLASFFCRGGCYDQFSRGNVVYGGWPVRTVQHRSDRDIAPPRRPLHPTLPHPPSRNLVHLGTLADTIGVWPSFLCFLSFPVGDATRCTPSKIKIAVISGVASSGPHPPPRPGLGPAAPWDGGFPPALFSAVGLRGAKKITGLEMAATVGSGGGNVFSSRQQPAGGGALRLPPAFLRLISAYFKISGKTLSPAYFRLLYRLFSHSCPNLSKKKTTAGICFFLHIFRFFPPHWGKNFGTCFFWFIFFTHQGKNYYLSKTLNLFRYFHEKNFDYSEEKTCQVYFPVEHIQRDSEGKPIHKRHTKIIFLKPSGHVLSHPILFLFLIFCFFCNSIFCFP